MKTKHFLFIFLCTSYVNTFAADKDRYVPNKFDSLYVNNYKTNNEIDYFSSNSEQNITFEDKLSLKWDISELISINFNIFENKYLFTNSTNFIPTINKNLTNKYKHISKLLISQPIEMKPNDNFNRNITGYKLGLSSNMGFGDDYKLHINLDYGLIDGADLTGFDNNEVNITSFALGIRKAKFGAKLNTDIFIEDNVDYKENSRLGFELDWYFSDDTVFSFGSKQHINNSSPLNQSNSLDNLTGNVQYIKFQHNL